MPRLTQNSMRRMGIPDLEDTCNFKDEIKEICDDNNNVGEDDDDEDEDYLPSKDVEEEDCEIEADVQVIAPDQVEIDKELYQV